MSECPVPKSFDTLTVRYMSIKWKKNVDSCLDQFKLMPTNYLTVETTKYKQISRYKAAICNRRCLDLFYLRAEILKVFVFGQLHKTFLAGECGNVIC